jgi:hypothetical protein
MARNCDVIVFGSTGYTGRLVAEHLLKTYGANGPVKWAMAGRARRALRHHAGRNGVNCRHGAVSLRVDSEPDTARRGGASADCLDPVGSRFARARLPHGSPREHGCVLNPNPTTTSSAITTVLRVKNRCSDGIAPNPMEERPGP